MAKPRLGSGARFKAVEANAAASGARNPAAVAASVGRKKYGNAKFQKLAAAGKKKSAPPSPAPPVAPMDGAY